MKRSKILNFHIAGSMVAVITIGVFFFSSLASAFYYDKDFTFLVKSGIFYTLPILLISMPMVVITGNKLAGNSVHPLLLEKKKRMKFIGINGVLLVMIACLLFYWAKKSDYSQAFTIIQVLELLLGFINLLLLIKNFQTGRKLSLPKPSDL
jgi:cytochrome bd-type quinol oxidase subunit 1